ncbi:MAG: M56 family metallopeptidase [Thermoguttaceae bacterium]
MNAIGIALVWCVVQVTVVGLLAAPLYLVVRRWRPAAAASVVLSGLVIVVVLSLMAFSPWPRWTVGQKALLAAGDVRQTDDRAVRTAATPRLETEDAHESNSVEPMSSAAIPPPAAAAPTASARLSAATGLWRSLLDELSVPVATSDAWRWPATVAMLLLVTMSCGLAWLLAGFLAVRWQRRRSRPICDREVLELVDLLEAELSCRRPVELRQSNNLASAATIGWRRPVVLLPTDWTSWTVDQRRAILAHEIAHARSHDFLALLFGRLGLVLHFYHPLLHWLMSRLRLEQELAADAAAAGVTGGQWNYLTTIAELALHQPDRPLLWPARSFLPTQTTFLRRVAMLRNSKLRFDRLSPAVRVITIGGMLLCGLMVAGLRPARLPQAVAAEDRNAAGESATHPTKDRQQAATNPSTQQGMKSLVEDFFRHNFRDVTSRETMEWGEVIKTNDGNYSIRYKYRAKIWYKETKIITQDFTFDKQGKFVSVKDVLADVSTKEGMQEHVEDFFHHNFRDVTSRKTIEWGEVIKTNDGNYSIRYKYRAKIWDKETKIIDQTFTFDPKGQFVSVKDADVIVDEGIDWIGSKKANIAPTAGPVARNDFIATQIREAEAGDYWAKYRLWAAYQKGAVGVPKDPEKAKPWLAQLVEGTYLATFRPANGFNPRTPGEFLEEFHKHSGLRSELKGVGGASFFRTRAEHGKLIGSFITAYPDKMRKAIADNPSLKLVSIEKMTPEMFVRYEASPQESLDNEEEKMDLGQPTAATGKELKYDDGKPDGRRSLGGSGEMIQFSLPTEKGRIQGIKIHGSRYGLPQPPAEDFLIHVLSADMSDILFTETAPYKLFQRGRERWVDVSFKKTREVPKTFWIVLDFKAHQTKGVYVSYDTSTGGKHSKIGLPGQSARNVDFGGDWMIRVKLADDKAHSRGKVAPGSATSEASQTATPQR